MSMKRIRDYYGVPAKRGAEIKFIDGLGVEHKCKIISAFQDSLKVRVDGIHSGRKFWLLHPTWNVEYI
jgi:hypothetical protein